MTVCAASRCRTLRDNLVAMIRAARRTRAEVLLVGMRMPPNYGPDYTKKFQAAFAEVARAEHVPLVPFLLEGFASQRDMFQSDGIHPNEQAQHWFLRTSGSCSHPSCAKPFDPVSQMTLRRATAVHLC